MYDYGMTPEEAHDNYIKEQAYKRGYEDAKKEFDRPHGEWTKRSDGFYKCPFCCYSDRSMSNFCPNCGSDMREGEKE